MKPSILIVDDEYSLRKLMARIIELEGYHVFEAASLKEALKILSNDSVQVVISDVRLPDGNGVEFTARIKKSIPVLK